MRKRTQTAFVLYISFFCLFHVPAQASSKLNVGPGYYYLEADKQYLELYAMLGSSKVTTNTMERLAGILNKLASNTNCGKHIYRKAYPAKWLLDGKIRSKKYSHMAVAMDRFDGAHFATAFILVEKTAAKALREYLEEIGIDMDWRIREKIGDAQFMASNNYVRYLEQNDDTSGVKACTRIKK